ncbi:MAG TPA: hypothetical protein PK074_12900 [Spirochaetales bacterium]|nr:hypothetical protein [Spirochaetales bacterium]
MSLDWDKINENLNTQITNSRFDLLQKKVTLADGKSIEYRDMREIASIQTIAKNNAALDAIETYGFGMKVEMDYE